jgi:hypothetical protein
MVGTRSDLVRKVTPNQGLFSGLLSPLILLRPGYLFGLLS